MGIQERQFPLSPEGEEFAAEKYVVDVESYEGNSQRILGFRRIKKAISGLSLIRTIEPLIILPAAYEDFLDNPQREHIEAISANVWSRLEGTNNPLIVRRLFPNSEGVSQDGPRSGNILSQEALASEIINFFEYYNKHYEGSDIACEFMVHKIIDAGNPPKLESPYLPFPGGDVIPLLNNKFQIRATFGADESVQNLLADVWEATLADDGSVEIVRTEKALKEQSYVPDTGLYRTIEIPNEYQKVPALNNIEVLSLAYACKNMREIFNPYRLEFDGTRVRGQDYLYIIESAPFVKPKHSKEALEYFAKERVNPINIIRSMKDIGTLSGENFPLIYIPKTDLQRGESRDYLQDLPAIAKERGFHLMAMIGGNVATEHAVRMLYQNGHDVIFCEDAEFDEKELIRAYSDNGEVMWEKENSVVSHEQLRGKNVQQIGGKARGHHKLIENGFETTPFFVIESSLFRRIIKESDAFELFKALDDAPPEEIGEITSKIQEKIRGYKGIPIELILAEADKLNAVNFSVRSSANCEDGKHAFAGTFETKLNNKRKDFNEAILEVLALCVSKSAITAVRAVKLKPSELKMAVIIQEMVESQKAGTIFTKDRIKDDPNILIIEAVAGQGEKLVSGQAEVHHSIEYDKLAKKVIKNDGNILLDSQMQRLIELGLDVEMKLAEGPQDIEWALDESGKIYLLQTRPL